MPERKILSTWKEIATYVNRGVRTVQRWEAEFSLPVHRTGEDRGSVFAFADELDGWLQRATLRARPYVRPTIIVLDQPLPNALSNRKLTLEIAKFNVLTAFTSAEMLATAERFDVDGFVIDSVMVERHPCELCTELKRMHPKKPLILIGETDGVLADHVLPMNDSAALLELAIKVWGEPKIAIVEETVRDAQIA
jgi:CheY-like chemotaxis protein